jgi:hypothetical protein
MCVFCNVWVCVGMGFAMCGYVYVGCVKCWCFDNCVGVLVIYAFVFAGFCIVCNVFL